jgi:hypothetical protein
MKKLFILIIFAITTGKSNAQTNNFFGSNINYQTGTIVLTTINATLTSMNLAGLGPKWQSEYTLGASLVTGACQLAYGIYNTGSNLSSLDLVNISAGTATLVANAIKFYQTLYSKKKTTSWNLFYAPGKNNCPEFGICIVKHFKI